MAFHFMTEGSVGVRLLRLFGRDGLWVHRLVGDNGQLNAPIAMQVPIVTDHLGRMHRAVSTIAAGQSGRRTITVAPPANTFGMFWADGKGLGHDGTRMIEG